MVIQIFRASNAPFILLAWYGNRIELGNTTLSTCSFQTGVRYCAKYFFGEAYVPPIVPEPELPIRDGTTPNCTEYLEVTEGWTCADILEVYKLTIGQFYTYNPAVLQDCSGMWLNYRYCVRDPSYRDPNPTISTETLPPTATGPPGPTQPGQPGDCNKWHIAIKDADTCTTIINTYFITLAQFLKWNPAVSSDCSAGLWGTYAYCIRTKKTMPSRHATSSHRRRKGTGASISPNKMGTPEQLYAVLGPGGSSCGSMLWATYWYCVGATE
ncbi:hypothetical protein BDZ91DRAFT_829613 [Kalaharituber pfeilii]|nr:hypothetical protein BDZ91DRAFT_829613 [Kalaharituber pfeilii]